MGLKEFYYQLEDKYYGLVDWLDKKGISLYPAIDAIESKNIPSFPVMALIAVIIVSLLAWLLIGIAAPAAAITFVVTDAEDNAPIDGAELSVSYGDQTALGLTKDGGKAVFVLPLGSDVTVTVTMGGYQTETTTFNASASMDKAIALLKEIEMLSKTIQLMNSKTNELLQKPVTLNFSCSNPESDFSETRATSSGIIELEVPSNCGNLLANPVAGFTVEDGVISLDDASPQLFLQEEETETGTVAVYVEDSDGETVAGATVRLVRSDGIEQQIEYSSTSGAAVFEKVPTGSYYVIVHDRQGRYADYDSSLQGDVKSLAKDARIEFSVTLTETVAGTIKVLVKDSSTSQPVENADVVLKKDNTVRDSQHTDSDGKVEFNVQENTAFDLEVNHPNYLIATLNNVSPKETFNEILLQPATSSNSQTLIVEVKDTRGNPIDGVKLVLKKSDGTIAGRTRVTGVDGMAEFPNLALETFYVYAVKKGFEGKNSNPITIQARQENKIVIVLGIGFGDIEVIVLDDVGEAVQGAMVEAYNIVTGEKENEALTSFEGTALFNVRADKKVFFRIDADGFLIYNTSALSPDPSAKTTKEVTLVKDATKLEVELVGLFLGEEKTYETTVAAGQTYTAKLLLKIPQGSRFNRAGIHLRTGNSVDDRINIMEEDDLYIRDASVSTLEVKRGTSYHPPTGYAEDSQHLTVGDSKWISVEWKNPTQGVYELDAEIQIRENVALGELLKIYYRGWGRTGSYVRYPADSELAGQESTANKQALYANANLETYAVGPTNLCDAFFCKSFTIEDLANNTRMRVVDEYPAVISSRYRLHFTVNSRGDKPLPESEIGLGSSSDGLFFTNYKIVDVLGSSSSGVAEAYDLSKPVGNIQKNSVVSGFIEFETEKEGSNKLTIVIKSDQIPAFEESIDVKVEAAEQLQIDVIPKEIVPFIDNLLLIKVTGEDEEGISNAIVTVWIDDIVVSSGPTNGQGEVSVELEAPTPGQVLKIAAQKNGYKPIEIEIAIDESILLVTPPEIKERLSVSAFEKEVGLLLSNLTAVEMQLTDIEISDDFEDLVEFVFEDDLIGKTLPVNSDANMFLTIKLTEAGFLVEEPRTLEGAISFYTKAGDMERTFVTNTLLEIRIALGGEVDDPDCLAITPYEWEIITSSGSKKTIELTLENNCKVDGTAVPLRDLQVRLQSKEDNLLGSFELSSDDIPGAGTVEISEDFGVFAESLPANFEGSVEIEFMPKSGIESAEAEYDIILKAINLTQMGEEALERRLPTAVFLSDLVECLKVIAPDPIEIQSSPWNQGYGNYQSFGYDPYDSGGYGGYDGGYGGYQGGIYPYSNFDLPNYSRYFDTGNELAWKYGLQHNTFRVENTCTIPVEIDLEVDAMLKTDETHFTLDPQESKDVAIESGYRLGKYQIKVKARASGSNDKYATIETINVIVKRADEIDEDCIKLVPEKISLNNFLGKPIPAKIYNYCYDQGVFLDKDGLLIEFTCQIPGEPTGTFNFAAAQGQKIEFQAGYTGGSQLGSWATQGGMYSPNEGFAQGNYGGGFYNYPYEGTSQGMYYPGGQYPYGSSGWGYAAEGYEGRCPLIDAIYIVGEKKSGGEEGKTIQVVEYEVKPSIQYRKQLCEYIAQLPFQTLYGLRMTASAAYYRSNVRATAQVHYRTAVGGRDSAFFSVMLEDMWGIGETIDECMRKSAKFLTPLEEYEERQAGPGNPRISDPGPCLNSNALDFATKYMKTNPSAPGFVPQSEFSGNIATLTPTPKVMRIHQQLCGWTDNLQDVKVSEPERKGARVSATVVDNGHNIQIKVDRSKLEYKCAIINTTVTGKLSRPPTWGQARPFVLTLRVWVLHKDFRIGEDSLTTCESEHIGPAGPEDGKLPAGEIKPCEGTAGETGEGIYDKFGFNRIKFNWGKDLHKEAYLCDEGPEDYIFCDALQFSLELNKKAKDVEDKLKDNGSWATSIAGSKEIVKAALGGISDEDLKDYQNTDELFRWAKKQVAVDDNAMTGTMNFVFFLKADNELLEEKRSKVLDALKDNLETVKDFIEKQTANYALHVEKTDEALNEIAKLTDYKDSVIATVDKGLDCTSKFKAQCDSIGIKKPTASTAATTFDNYALTFNDYKTFHNALWTALKTDDKCTDKDGTEVKGQTAGKESPTEEELKAERAKATKCNISLKIDGADKEIEINVAFLKELLGKIKFTVAVQHKKEGMDEVKARIIQEAADIKDGWNIKEWYPKNVSFKSFLMGDAYSKEMREDFASEYKDEAITGFADWEISGANEEEITETVDEEEKKRTKITVDAGKHGVLINYNWAHKKFTLELAKEKTLAQIDKGNENTTKTAYASNPLFKLPFDGKMKNTAGNKRVDYGTSFAAVGRKLVIAEEAAKEGLQVTFTDLALSNSEEKIAFVSSQKLDDTASKDGTVLKISKDRFEFSPTTPVVITANIGDGPGTEEGMVYELAEQAETQGFSSLIKWDFGLDEKISDVRARSGMFCGANVDVPHFGFVGQPRTATGIIFMPFETPYTLHVFCARGQTTLASKARGVEKGSTTIPATTNSIKPLKLKDSEKAQDYSLGKIIAEIKESKMCVTNPGAETITLRWNPGAFLK